jgi:hypothetical protein
MNYILVLTLFLSEAPHFSSFSMENFSSLEKCMEEVNRYTKPITVPSGLQTGFSYECQTSEEYFKRRK